ncbi:MAG: hypothetical protein J5I65_11975 [Aridibacter famidurans]|nr:hypothetical protein [Aridibacter famidurans]
MINLFAFIKDQVLFSRRMAEVKERQERDGYSVQLVSEGPAGQYAEYKETDRETWVGVNFGWSWQSICVDEIKRWEPRCEEVSADERRRIVARIARYLSCWGGEVRFEKCYMDENRELKVLLEDYGIPFKESAEFLLYDPATTGKSM